MVADELITCNLVTIKSSVILVIFKSVTMKSPVFI